MAGLMDGLRALVSSKRHEEHKSAWDGYASVLRDLAEGQELDPIEVSQALEAVGRSVDDLESDLEKYRKRLEWRQELDRLPQLQRDLAAAVKAHDAAKSEYDRIVPVLAAKVEGAYVAKSAIENAIDAARMSEGWLLAQPLNTVLIEQERRLSERLSVLMGERQDWQAKVAAEVKNAEYAAGCAERQPEHATYHRELQEAYRKRAKAFDPHLERVEQSIAEVQRELVQVRAAKLQP